MSDDRPPWFVRPLGEGAWNGCYNCDGAPPRVDLGQPLAMETHGIFFTLLDNRIVVTRDEDVVWIGSDPEVTVADVEAIAVEDPDHDWRISFEASLWDCTYQRHGEGLWEMIEKKRAF